MGIGPMRPLLLRRVGMDIGWGKRRGAKSVLDSFSETTKDSLQDSKNRIMIRILRTSIRYVQYHTIWDPR